MEPTPLILEAYPHADDPAHTRQVRLCADLDEGVYDVEWSDSRDGAWIRVHESEDPAVALGAVNDMIAGFGYEGFRDRWGDPPAPIGLQQLMDAELAAQMQREHAVDAHAPALEMD